MNLDDEFPDGAHEALRLALVEARTAIADLQQTVADLTARVAALEPAP